ERGRRSKLDKRIRAREVVFPSLFQGRYLSNAHSIGALFANVAIGTTSDIYEESQKRLAYAARSEFINKDKEDLQSASDNSERSSPSSVISLTQ
ncbi:hypothetical protein, partial [Porphyromonas endodontalis]|uniref:hypothetical protein n=1 Tax=Porphyromonas endodontalis TaxID=28124 RepID=UPI0028EBF05E